MKFHNLKLIMLFGKPGSGKTFLSKRLAKVTQFIRISTDETRYNLFPDASFDDLETYFLWEVLYNRINSYLSQDNGVIIDGNIGKLSYRDKIINQFFYGTKKHYISLYVYCSDLIALTRIKNRSFLDNPFGCDIESFKKIKQEIELSKNDNILIFSNNSNSKLDFEVSFSRLISKLESKDGKSN